MFLEWISEAKKKIEDLGGADPYIIQDMSTYSETRFMVNYTRAETLEETKVRLLAEEKNKARQKKYEQKHREEKTKRDLAALKRLAKKYPKMVKEAIGEQDEAI